MVPPSRLRRHLHRRGPHRRQPGGRRELGRSCGMSDRGAAGRLLRAAVSCGVEALHCYDTAQRVFVTGQPDVLRSPIPQIAAAQQQRRGHQHMRHATRPTAQPGHTSAPDINCDATTTGSGLAVSTAAPRSNRSRVWPVPYQMAEQRGSRPQRGECGGSGRRPAGMRRGFRRRGYSGRAADPFSVVRPAEHVPP